MISIVESCDKEQLCSQCHTRGYFCYSDLYRCDCCSCMPELCNPKMDLNEVKNPFSFKEVTLEQLLLKAKEPLEEREVINA